MKIANEGKFAGVGGVVNVDGILSLSPPPS